MSSNQASIVAAIGASGSGKSAWIKRQLAEKRPERLIVWDPQDEYGAFGQVYSDRVKLIAALRAPTFSVIYRPGDRQSEYEARFDWLCRVVYALGELVYVVEELADVTSASRAPDAWSAITRKGRHRALRVVAASQRPARVDKDFFGNCTLIHCGRLTYRADVVTMADVLNVEQAEIAQLAPLSYIERSMATGELRRGALTFPAPSRAARARARPTHT